LNREKMSIQDLTPSFTVFSNYRLLN